MIDLEALVPRVIDGVGLCDLLRARLSVAWCLAQSTSNEEVCVDTFVRSALRELSERRLIDRLETNAKRADHPEVYMVQFWEIRRYGNRPAWVARLNVDWQNIWSVLTPTWQAGMCAWRCNGKVLASREKRLEDMLTPSMAWTSGSWAEED